MHSAFLNTAKLIRCRNIASLLELFTDTGSGRVRNGENFASKFFSLSLSDLAERIPRCIGMPFSRLIGKWNAVAEVALELRCSKTHVYNVIAGKVDGVRALPAISMARRKLVRRCGPK